MGEHFLASQAQGVAGGGVQPLQHRPQVLLQERFGLGGGATGHQRPAHHLCGDLALCPVYGELLHMQGESGLLPGKGQVPGTAQQQGEQLGFPQGKGIVQKPVLADEPTAAEDHFALDARGERLRRGVQAVLGQALLFQGHAAQGGALPLAHAAHVRQGAPGQISQFHPGAQQGVQVFAQPYARLRRERLQQLGDAILGEQGHGAQAHAGNVGDFRYQLGKARRGGGLLGKNHQAQLPEMQPAGGNRRQRGQRFIEAVPGGGEHQVFLVALVVGQLYGHFHPGGGGVHPQAQGEGALLPGQGGAAPQTQATQQEQEQSLHGFRLLLHSTAPGSRQRISTAPGSNR